MHLDGRPRLAAKARLRRDPRTDGWLLLYPERGLALNATGADVVQLCTGEHTVAGIVERLAAKYEAPPAVVEEQVAAFLRALLERGLIADAP